MLLHDVKVKSDGKWIPVTLKVAPNHSQSIALAGNACHSDGTMSRYPLEFTGPDKFTELKFTIGVPFHLNHLNPLEQKAPLNRPDMFWVWRNGHKFLRLELENKTSSLTYHLGSTGCSSISSIRPPSKACEAPNLITINLSSERFQEQNVIELDLNQLIEKVITPSSQKVDREVHCLSGPENLDCQKLNHQLTHSFQLKTAE